MPPSPLSTDEGSSTAPGPTTSPLATADSTLHSTRHHHHPAVHSFYPILSPVNLSDNFIHAFSGATAGLVSGIITCPLDVIKTKLQAQGGFELPGNGIRRSRGFTGTARMIWVEEGLKGMYRGLAPIILGYLPTWAVYFTVYEKSKSVLRQTEIKQQWVTHILSAMIAGASSTMCTNPIWVIKTRLMAQASQAEYLRTNSGHAPWHYNGTIDAIRKMYAHEGFRAFYSGLGPALLGLTHVAVQFPLYEQFKKIFVRTNVNRGDTGDVDFLGILAASCLSKICASSATYPHEVLRTRLQTQFTPNGRHHPPTGAGGGFVSGDGSHARAAGKGAVAPAGEKPEVWRPRYVGVIKSARTVYREEGWRAFYAGMGTNMIRAVPASAMTLLTYEICSNYLLKWKRTGVNPGLLR